MVESDALVPSLAERIRALADMPSRADRVRVLGEVLGGVTERVRAVEDIVDGLDARVEQTRAQLRDEGRAEVILRRALTAGGPSPRHAASRRDRHGLYLVQGTAIAAVVCVARWSWRAGAHKAVIAGTVLVMARHVLGW